MKGRLASAEIDSLALTRVKGVGVVSYLLEQQVLLEQDGLQTMATLRGVDDRYTEVFPIETIPLGSWSVRTGDLDRLVLGRDMARTLESGLWSVPKSPSMPCGAAVSRRCFPSMDIRCGGSTSEDSSFSIWKARMNTHLPPACSPGTFRSSGTHIGDLGARSRRCGRGKVRREIAGIVGDDFTVRTRDEMNALFFRLVAYEKWGVFFISLLVWCSPRSR